MGSARRAARPRWPVYLMLLALVLAPAAVYWPVLGYPFINWDDPLNVVENPQIKRPGFEGIKEILLHSARVSNYYIPLTFLSFAADYALFGLDGGAFHRTGLVLHILNGLLVFWVFAHLTRSPLLAFLAAGLFSLHPLSVESTAWVSERKGLLASFFLLLALLAYLRQSAEVPGKFYVASVLLFLLSLLSKPMGLTFPFLLLLADRFRGRPWDRRALLEKIPFLAASLLFGVLSLLGQESGGALGGRSIAAWENLWAAGYGFLFYLHKFLLPVNLSAYYPYPAGLGPLYLALAAAVLGGIFFLRRHREVFFGLGFFCVALVPVMKLVPFGDFIAADRLAYFPSIGLSFLAAWAPHRLWERFNPPGGRRPARFLAAAALLLILLSVLARERLEVWQSSEKLWKNVLHSYPGVAAAHMNLGYEYAARGRLEEGVSEYCKALEIDPKDAKTHNNLGTALRRMGLWDDAVRSYRTALEIDPRYAPAHTNLGLAYEQKGNLEEAIASHRKSLEIDPRSSLARANLAAAYMRAGNLDRAIEESRRAVALDPGSALARANLGAALGQKGMLEEAISELREALLLDPRYAKAHYNLAAAYLRKDDRKKAEYHMEMALRLRQPAPPGGPGPARP